MKFKSYKELLKLKKLKVDDNLSMYNFSKMNHAEITMIAFRALSDFIKQEGHPPKP